MRNPEARAESPSTRFDRERTRFALYAAPLLTTWALAVSNTLFAVMLLAVPWLGTARPPVGRGARRAIGFAAAYLVLLVGAVAASRDVAESFWSLSEILRFATFFLALLWLRRTDRVRWLVDALVLVGAAVAVSGLGQILLGYGGIDRRIRGPFSHYMTFAGTLLLLDLLLVSRMLLRRGGGAGRGPTAWLDRPVVAWAALGLINLALIISLTRSAWLALVASLVGVLAVVRPRLLLLALPLAAVFVVLAPEPLIQRVLSISHVADDSNYDRIVMAEAGARMVGERPLLGIGPDMVRRYYPVYRDPSAPRLLTPHLHDAYVELAAERGLPALICYLGLLGTSAWAAWRGFRRERGSGSGRADLHLGALAALTGFSIAALFENNWGDTEVQRLVLFLLAVPFCLEAGAAEAGPAAGEDPG